MAPTSLPSPRLHPAIVHDTWLSERMGKAAYQLRLDDAELPSALADDFAALLDGDVFVSTKVSTTAVGAVAALERIGFHVTDTQVVLERALAATDKIADDALQCRLARDDDKVAVEEIARSSFRFTRFHLDPRVPRAVANDIKAQWAANFFTGRRGDFLVVAEHQGVVAGFNQLLRYDGSETLLIDLIAVAERHQGLGAASAMIAFAARQAGSIRRYRVATQVANIPSLRLYEKLGFRMRESQYVLHAHGRGSR